MKPNQRYFICRHEANTHILCLYDLEQIRRVSGPWSKVMFVPLSAEHIAAINMASPGTIDKFIGKPVTGILTVYIDDSLGDLLWHLK